MQRQNQADINTPERYDEIYFSERTQQLLAYDFVKNFLLMTVKNDTVLDIGCGLGRYFPYFTNCQIVGIDYAPKTIEQAKKDHPYATALVHDVVKDGLGDFQNFDYIFCAEVIEHLENPQALINEMYKAVKDGGIVITTTPYKDRIKVAEHLWEFDYPDLKEMFKDFRHVAVARYFNVWQDDWEHFIIIAQK